MIRTVLSMLCRPGHEAEFERIWRAAAEQIALQPGNRGQTLLRDANEPRWFVISSEWASREDLKRFEDSPVRRQLSADLDPLREQASKSVLTVVVTVTSGAPNGDRSAISAGQRDDGSIPERSTIP
jgi:heme-degrading monooxygenase HmoA